MARLKSLATIVFLDVSLPQLRQRITNFDQRGIARKPNQTLEELFLERRALYQRYADLTIDCDQQSVQQVLETLSQRLR